MIVEQLRDEIAAAIDPKAPFVCLRILCFGGGLTVIPLHQTATIMLSPGAALDET